MIPINEIDTSFELAKDGTFRFADKKTATIPKFRKYHKRKEKLNMTNTEIIK